MLVTHASKKGFEREIFYPIQDNFIEINSLFLVMPRQDKARTNPRSAAGFLKFPKLIWSSNSTFVIMSLLFKW